MKNEATVVVQVPSQATQQDGDNAESDAYVLALGIVVLLLVLLLWSLKQLRGATWR